MAKRFPNRPAHPERNCWGCDKYCPSTSLMCGNGSERTQHPMELFGDDWAEWGAEEPGDNTAVAATPAVAPAAGDVPPAGGGTAKR